MLGTILLLIITVVVLPAISFYFGTPLSTEQWEILHFILYILSGVITYCFIVGQLTKNSSQTDKLWSIVPIYYVWQITAFVNFPSKMVLMSVLVTIWGLRLTYNFGRRGGYSWKFWSGEEDYRWDVLRKKPGFSNPIVWALFDLFFISGYQQVLILLFTLPILTVVGTSGADTIGIWDVSLALLFISWVVIEFVADQQQYNFQTEKHRRMKSGEPLGDYAHGFTRNGLWGIVRHPNYAMEQMIWLTFYGFSVVATGEWFNWSAAGALLLIILFKSSSDFSEDISANKYPEYKDYQRQVPRFIPVKLKATKKVIQK